MNLKKIYLELQKMEEKEEVDKEKMKEILREIEVEIITNGKINMGILTAYKRLLSINNSQQSVFKQISINSKNNYFFCNGFVYVEYGTKNNIPIELIPYIECEIKEYEKPTLNFENLSSTHNPIKQEEIEISKLKKVINYNKINKTNICYNVEDVFFNPNLLLNLILITGHTKEKVIKINYTTNISPIFFDFDNCNCLLLPVALGDKEEKTKNIEIFNKILAC